MGEYANGGPCSVTYRWCEIEGEACVCLDAATWPVTPSTIPFSALGPKGHGRTGLAGGDGMAAQALLPSSPGVGWFLCSMLGLGVL